MDKISEIQRQIKSALEEFENVKRVDLHLSKIEEKLSNSYKELERLDKVLDAELKDIERLESIGVKSLFHKVLGSQEQQLEKERQEFLEASLKYKEFKSSVELMEYEKQLLDKKVHRLPEIEQEIKRLKTLREKELMQSNSSLKSDLILILDKIDASVLLLKELTEAYSEGEKSEKLLQVVLSYLKKARDWGRWENRPSGRGGMIKHSAIDHAIKGISKAQLQLNLFEKELEDLGVRNKNFKLNPSQFNQFTDFFFNNLISDWIVQQKIRSTIASIESTIDNVTRTTMTLDKEIQICRTSIAKLEEEKEKILLQ